MTSMATDPWLITNEDYSAETLARCNSVFTVCNGYLSITGNVQEQPEGPVPLTLINGLYDELNVFSTLRPSAQPRPWLDERHFDSAGPDPAVANLPDPLYTRIFLDNAELTLAPGSIREFRQVLDLRTGIYQYSYRYTNGGAAAFVQMQRFASLCEPHCVYLRYRITACQPARFAIWTGINTLVTARLVPERQHRVVGMEAKPGLCRVNVCTRAHGHEVSTVVAGSLWVGGQRQAGRPVQCREGPCLVYEFQLDGGQTAVLDRVICLSCSDDARLHGHLPPPQEPAPPAPGDFERAAQAQARAWQKLWPAADVRIGGDEHAQRCLRFCAFHLLAAAPRFSDSLSVPVKLLSGDYYQGNVFYDTDLYIVPFYTFKFPELARTCLNFRWAGLDYGRQWARARGWRGAKLAWQAGPQGQECLGRWHRFGETNIHINSAVVWALTQYLHATGDHQFLVYRGIDLLVESARFYASRAEWDSQGTCCDLHRVTGPDESHCAVDSSFYTNYAAAMTLRWAAQSIRALAADDPATFAGIADRLSLLPEEVADWSRTADALKIPFDRERGMFEQFAGFFRLPPPPADLLARRREWFVPLWPYQALNQPDVLMALALFRDDFDEPVRRASWEYYKTKSLNLSSMSFAVNAIMAADMGDGREAYRNFLISAGMDLDPTLTGRNDTHQGLHGTAMGGAWLALMLGFAGLHLRATGLEIRPRLPDHWERVQLSLMLRGRRVFVDIDHSAVRFDAEQELPSDIAITVAGKPVSAGASIPYHS